MTDPNTPNGAPGESRPKPMASHSEGADQRTADLHHNQDTAVRSSGDQPRVTPPPGNAIG